MEDEDQKQKKSPRSIFFGVLAVFVVAAGALWFIYSQEKERADSNVGQPTATTTINIGGVTVELPPGSIATVEQVNINPQISVPDLDRNIVFPKDFSEEARVVWRGKHEAIKKQIVEQPKSYDLWVAFGLSWNTINDYEGARLAWEYAVLLAPSAHVAFGNLGFLYGYYLHDNVKAELNFRRALANAPTTLYLYGQLFEFYRDVVKNVAKARALAEEGKRATGDSVFFDQLLGTL